MVLHVGRALDVLGIGGIALELREDRGVGLAHEVGEHVEPAAMGHADDDLVQAELAAALEDLLQRRDQRFAAVEAEALGAGVFLVEEPLEHLGRGQPLQDRPLAHVGEAGLVVAALDALLDPGLLGRILDVHVLDADLAAIGLAHDLHDLAQRRRLVAEQVVDEDRPVHVGVGEAVGRGIELGVALPRLQVERIEAGFEMAAHAIGADQHARADGILGRCLHRLDAGQPRSDRRRGRDRRAVAVHDDGGPPRRPAGAAQVLEHGAAVVLQLGEETRQLGSTAPGSSR